MQQHSNRQPWHCGKESALVAFSPEIKIFPPSQLDHSLPGNLQGPQWKHFHPARKDFLRRASEALLSDRKLNKDCKLVFRAELPASRRYCENIDNYFTMGKGSIERLTEISIEGQSVIHQIIVAPRRLFGGISRTMSFGDPLLMMPEAHM
jgi:hypothetical protein